MGSARDLWSLGTGITNASFLFLAELKIELKMAWMMDLIGGVMAIGGKILKTHLGIRSLPGTFLFFNDFIISEMICSETMQSVFD